MKERNTNSMEENSGMREKVYTELGIGAVVPEYASEGAAAADLYAAEGSTIHSGCTAKVDTRVKVAIPEGHVGLVVSRSGLAFREGIIVLNGVGVIDSDYRGNVAVLLWNTGDSDFQIEPGNRIAQMLIVPVSQPDYVTTRSLDATKRGDGGFGSTGL